MLARASGLWVRRVVDGAQPWLPAVSTTVAAAAGGACAKAPAFHVATRSIGATPAAATVGTSAGGGGGGSVSYKKSTSGARRAPTFRGVYLSTPKGSVHIRVLHAKFAVVGDNSYALQKQGRILLEIAPLMAAGEGGKPPMYDWNHKVYFYLNAQDLMTFGTASYDETITFTRGNAAPGSDPTLSPAPRTLSLKPVGERPREGRVWELSISAPAPGGGVVTHAVDLKTWDIINLRTMFQTAVQYVSGWIYHLNPTTFDPDVNVARKGEDDGLGGGGKGE